MQERSLISQIFRISWLMTYAPFLGILSLLLALSTLSLLFQNAISSAIFFAGCLLHSFWNFGLAFMGSAMFKSASTANRVTHIVSFLLFAAYFASGFLRTGILYQFSPYIFYALCLLEPIAFGTLIQRVSTSFFDHKII